MVCVLQIYSPKYTLRLKIASTRTFNLKPLSRAPYVLYSLNILTQYPL